MAIVNVESNRYTLEDPLYQWDKNQVLYIYGLSLPSVPEIHFYNETMDRAIVRQASMDDAGVVSVNIPNSLLQKPYKIKVFVCNYSDDTFESQYKIEIPVNARKQPSDYTIEDTDGEIYSFKTLENAVNNLDTNIKNTIGNNVIVIEDGWTPNKDAVYTYRSTIHYDKLTGHVILDLKIMLKEMSTTFDVILGTIAQKYAPLYHIPVKVVGEPTYGNFGSGVFCGRSNDGSTADSCNITINPTDTFYTGSYIYVQAEYYIEPGVE